MTGGRCEGGGPESEGTLPGGGVHRALGLSVDSGPLRARTSAAKARRLRHLEALGGWAAQSTLRRVPDLRGFVHKSVRFKQFRP